MIPVDDSAVAESALQGSQRTSGRKPIVLTFVGNYLPGFKAGGILRALANSVELLRDRIEFRIVTRDRDLGDVAPYDGISPGTWQPVGSALVYYLDPRVNPLKQISHLLSTTPHDVVYLNSFFEPITLSALLVRKFRRKSSAPFIVAPRGEFAWASLGQKYWKKSPYIRIARIAGLYQDVTWHVSTSGEAEELARVMNPNPEAIHVARDLPNLAAAEVLSDAALPPAGDGTELRIVFLGRIAREKNLDFALKVLGRVSCNVTLDIYGPVDNEAHWNVCLALIRNLPPNVTACYRGSHSQPSRILGLYDLLLLPTGGENYGHVIAEALTAGTPVLISDKTPWRNLREDGLGWDIPLDDADSFRRVIEECACATGAERARSKHHIRSTITKRLFDPAAVEANTRLFTDQVPRRTTATRPRSLPGFS